MRNKEREAEARLAAEFIRKELDLSEGHTVHAGLVLGTGWGDTLKLEQSRSVSLDKVPGFESLGSLEGHARSLVYGTIAGKNVLALRGRVHLNESPSGDALPKMVRLQVEALFQLGVRNLVITSAVGSLTKGIGVGDLVVVDGFLTVFAPPMPLWAGEFCSPEDMLDEGLQTLAHAAARDIRTHKGCYAMVRGPFFEGRKYDKQFIRDSGASVVGMSMLPEACIAALYNVKTLGLSFVTNNHLEEHSHEENLARAKLNSQKLGGFLCNVIEGLPVSVTA